MLNAAAIRRRIEPLVWVVLALATLGAAVGAGKLAQKIGLWAWLAALVPAAGLFGLARPAWIVYALAFTVPLTSGMERGGLIPFFRPNEALLFGLVYLAAAAFLVRRRPIRFTWVDGLLLGFLAFRVLLPTAVFLFRGEPWGSLALKTLYGPIQYYLIYRMAVECIDSWEEARTAVFALLVSSALVSGLGILQALQLPGINEFIESVYPSDKDIYTFLFSERVTSTWGGDWNGCGLFLAMSVILGLGIHHTFPRPGQRVAVLLISFLDLVVMFLTASFTGAICLFLGLTLLFIHNPPARRLIRPALIAAPLIGLIVLKVFWDLVEARIDAQFSQVAVSWVPHSFRIRIYMWRELMWPWVERFWLWGLGPYRWGWPDEESYYMFLILKSGIFGLVSYVVLTIGMAVRLRRYLPHVSTTAGALAVVLAIHIFQVLVANSTGSYGEANGVVEILWLSAGFLMGAELRGQGPWPARRVVEPARG